MSITLEVYCDLERVPSVEAWSKAIQEAGFPLTIDAPEGLKRQSGFMVVMNEGQRSGFEFDLRETKDADFDENPDLQEAVGTRKMLAHFRYSRQDEHAVAYPAALVLALQTGGIFYDPQEGAVLSEADELRDQLLSMCPGYWLNQEVELVSLPEMGSKRKMRDVMKSIGALVTASGLAEARAPQGVADRVVDGIPLLELSSLPVATMMMMAERGITLQHPELLGRTVVAIDRIYSQLSADEQAYFARTRELCEKVLNEMHFAVRSGQAR